MKYPLITLLLVLLVGCAPKDNAFVGKVYQAGDTDSEFVRLTFVDATTCQVRIYMREYSQGSVTSPKDTIAGYPYVIEGKYVKMTRDGKVDLYEIKEDTLVDPIGGTFKLSPTPREPKPGQTHVDLNLP